MAHKSKRLPALPVLLLALLTVLTACSAVQDPPVPASPAATAAPVAVTPEAAPETVPATAGDPAVTSADYREILDQCYRLLSSGPETAETLTLPAGMTGIREISMYEPGALFLVGYDLSDLNGDGTPELLIGSGAPVSGGLLYAVYGYDGEAPFLMLEGWQRNRFYLLDDGRFLNEGSSGAMYSMFGTYRLSADAGSLTCEDFYFTCPKNESDFDVAYYHNTSGVWDPEQAEMLDLSDEAFWSLDAALSAHLTVPSLTPFAFYSPSYAVEPLSVFPADAVLFAYGTWTSFEADDSEYRTPILVTASSAVSDFRFLSLDYSESTDGLPYSSEVLYSAEHLDPACPFLVTMTFFGDLPSYGVSYTDDSGTVRTFAIAQSGRDGSLFLMPLDPA